MEDIDGGLHPAEDGQSLDKDEDEDAIFYKRNAIDDCNTLRDPDQNGVSLLYVMLEINHSGREHSTCCV